MLTLRFLFLFYSTIIMLIRTRRVLMVVLMAMLLVILVLMTVIVVVVVDVRLSFRYRSWCVVIFAKNRDVQSGDRSHSSSPNPFRFNLEFIGQFGHTHCNALCHVLFQLVGIARCVETRRQQHVACGSRKTVKMSMIRLLLLIGARRTTTCR